jgi:hypothetical protein
VVWFVLGHMERDERERAGELESCNYVSTEYVLTSVPSDQISVGVPHPSCSCASGLHQMGAPIISLSFAKMESTRTVLPQSDNITATNRRSPCP